MPSGGPFALPKTAPRMAKITTFHGLPGVCWFFWVLRWIAKRIDKSFLGFLGSHLHAGDRFRPLGCLPIVLSVPPHNNPKRGARTPSDATWEGVGLLFNKGRRRAWAGVHRLRGSVGRAPCAQGGWNGLPGCGSTTRPPKPSKSVIFGPVSVREPVWAHRKRRWSPQLSDYPSECARSAW